MGVPPQRQSNTATQNRHAGKDPHPRSRKERIAPKTKTAKTSAARGPLHPPVECSDQGVKLLPHLSLVTTRRSSTRQPLGVQNTHAVDIHSAGAATAPGHLGSRRDWAAASLTPWTGTARPLKESRERRYRLAQNRGNPIWAPP